MNKAQTLDEAIDKINKLGLCVTENDMFHIRQVISIVYAEGRIDGLTEAQQDFRKLAEVAVGAV